MKVEDLVDTGNTLSWLKSYLVTKQCASVRICSFLDKKARRTVEDITIDYIGYHCPNDFVVGYGMDFNEAYRGLDCICSLFPETFQK